MKGARKSLLMVLAFLVGALIALATRRGAGPDTRSSLQGGLARAKGEISRTTGSVREHFGAGRNNGDKCRIAWDEMLKASVPEREKRELAARILGRWAEVDPRGALFAALDANHKGWDQASLFPNLLDAFDQSFADNPLPYLDLISRGELGLDTRSVAEHWTKRVAHKDPQLVIMSFDRLPSYARDLAIMHALRQAPLHPDQQEAITSEVKRRLAEQGVY